MKKQVGSRIERQWFTFFTAWSDVRGAAKRLSNRAHFVVVVARVHAQALFPIIGKMQKPLVFDALRNACQRLAHQLHVMAVGSVNHNANRNATRFSQQASLDAAYGTRPAPTGRTQRATCFSMVTVIAGFAPKMT